MSSAILLVDDEPNILRALQRTLSETEWDILTAQSGPDGLELLKRHDVAVVVSDQRMPEMTGDEFLRRVRRLQPDAVRIVLTGFADIDAIMSLINSSGVHRYIMKPWDDSELKLILKNAVEFHQMVAENRRLSKLTKEQNRRLKELGRKLVARSESQSELIEDRNRELARLTDWLRQQRQSTLEAFSMLLEMVEPLLGEHSRRVAERARELARLMQMSEAEVEAVAIAGLMHDIGKLGLDPALCRKRPEELVHTEREFLKRHPVRGQSALRPIAAFQEIGLMIRHHHERFDGRGYPDELAGEAIPLGARILAVANAFDHMLSRGGSKSANENEAYQRLRQQAGRFLDPKIVELASATLKAAGSLESSHETRLNLLTIKPGMVLSRDLLSKDGLLIAAQGATVDDPLIDAAWRLNRAGRLSGELFVYQS